MQDIVIEQHQKIASDDMGGLEPKLFLAVGARTMLTRNPWARNGLCDGSLGTISDIVYKKDEQPAALPMAYIVKFDSSYTAPSFLSDITRCPHYIRNKRVRCVWFFTRKIKSYFQG